MIKPRSTQQPLFLTYEEMPQPLPHCRYSRINGLIGDWRSLSKPLEPAFKRTGRPTDPVVFLKIFLVGALEGIVYDTVLAARIADSISLRGFLGFGLAETTPDHSTISLVRKRVAVNCDLRAILEAVVERCLAAGLDDNSVLAVDATVLTANASLDSLRHVESGLPINDHRRLEARKAELAAAEVAAAEAAAAEAAAAEAAAAEAATAEAAPAEAAPAEAAPAEAAPATEAAPTTEAAPATKSSRAAKAARIKLSNSEFVSLTDPDARIAKKRNQPPRMGYQATTLTNSNQIILAVATGHADKGEVEAAREVVAAGLAWCGSGTAPAPYVVADKGYDAASFHQHIEAHGGVPVTHIRPPHEEKPKALRKDQFVYQPELNAYRCPNGKLLPFRAREHQDERSRYHSLAADCAACPLAKQCLSPGAQIRTISRADGEASRDRARLLADTELGKALRGKRMGLVEGPFGFWKENGGLSRINCRGLAKAGVKVIVSAIGWNLLRLLHHVFPDPIREGSKQRRAEHQQRRREAKARSAEGDTSKSASGASNWPLTAPARAVWTRLSHLGHLLLQPADWSTPTRRRLAGC